MNIDFVTEQLVKDIALTQFRKDNNMMGQKPSDFPSIEQASEKTYGILRELLQATEGELFQKIFNFEDSLSDLTYAESEENFVLGFVRGYFFLKQILESSDQAIA